MLMCSTERASAVYEIGDIYQSQIWKVHAPLRCDSIGPSGHEYDTSNHLVVGTQAKGLVPCSRECGERGGEANT